MPTNVDFTFNGPFVNENHGDVINEAAETINISYTNGNNNTISHGSKQVTIGSSNPSSSPFALEGSHPHPMIEASAQDARFSMRSLSDTPYNETWLDYPMQDACTSSRPPLPRKSEMPLYIDPSAPRVPSSGVMSMSGGPSTSPYSDDEALWNGFSGGDTSNSESPWSAFPPQDTPALGLPWSSSPDEGMLMTSPDHHAREHQHENLSIMPYNHQNELLPPMEGDLVLHSQQQAARSSMGRYFPDILHPLSMVPSFPGGVIQPSTFHHNLNSYPSSNNQSISHTVNGISINNNKGDIYNFDAASDPLRLLKDVAIVDATHNAEARKPLQLNLHPSTRTKPLAVIRTWFQSKENVSPVFWLSGGVGVGKSAIAQRICNEFHKEGTLAASFFFSQTQDETGSNSIRVLVCKLVYQLALLNKATGMKLRKLLHQYPDLLEQSAEDIFEQFFELLGEVDEESTTKLVVIDGLEKCHDAKFLPAQARVLDMINKIIGDPRSSSRLFKFLLCFRTDDRIWDYSASFSMDPVHFEVGGRFDDTIQEDIERFLADRLTALSAKHGFQVNDGDIKTLTRRAGNQFIYAQAVVDHLSQTRLGLSPRMLLQGVLNLRPRSRNNPYEGLDSLYREILSKITEWEWRPLLRLILTPPLNSGSGSGYPTQPGTNGETLTLERRENIVTYRTCWLLANSLGLETDDIRIRLAQLESVVCGRKKNEVYDDHTSIIFRHVSFVEFLTSPNRSHDFYIERLSDVEMHDLLAQGCLRRASEYCSHYMSPENLKDQLKKDGRYKKGSAEMGKNAKEWTFDGHALNYWLHHCKRSLPSLQVVEALNEFDPYAYLATGLRMGNWREPWYNPSRYQERTELVWEWMHHLNEALEWAKTLENPPLRFIERCNELLWSGLALSLPNDTPDRECYLEAMKTMLTFFVATVGFTRDQRGPIYEYWVEKLPEGWRLKAEDIVEQAGYRISLQTRTQWNSVAVQVSKELRDCIEDELRHFMPPKQLKGQKRAHSRILRSTARYEREMSIFNDAVGSLRAQFGQVVKKKGPKMTERRRSALKDCESAASAFLEWIEGLDQDSKKAIAPLTEDLRRIIALAEYDIVAYGKQVEEDRMID